MTWTPKMRKCLSLDCNVEFLAKYRNQFYHSKACRLREKGRRNSPNWLKWDKTDNDKWAPSAQPGETDEKTRQS